MKNFKELYRKLPTESRLNFWIITTNIFVVMFTFILGLFIQYLVANTSAQASRKIAHYDIVDKMYPAYNKLTNSTTFYNDFSFLLDENINVSTKTSIAKSYLLENKNELITYAANVVSVTGKYKYYFEKNNFDEISSNNGLIINGLIILQCIQNDTHYSEKQFIDYYKDKIVDYDLFSVATPNKNITESAESAYKVYSQLKLSPNDASLVIGKLIMHPVVKNLMVINEELRFVNGKTTMNWAAVVNWESLVAFLIIISFVILIWLKACGLIVKRIAHAPSDYLNTIKRIEKDCDYYKSQIGIKDIEIEKQNEDIKSKKALISELDNQVLELKHELIELKK